MKKFNEPVLVAHYVAALLAALVTFLVAHGVITNAQASPLVQAIAPVLTAAALTGLGWITRHYVAPAWKVTEALAAKAGVDLATVEQAAINALPAWSQADLAAAGAVPLPSS